MHGNCLGSQSQNVLCTAVKAGFDVSDHKGILVDQRTPEEILADELPNLDAPDAMEKAAIRSRKTILQTYTDLACLYLYSSK